MAEALDETGPFLVLEDYFNDEGLEISFSNMSIDGKYEVSRFIVYTYDEYQMLLFLFKL